jgi:hypothetical protein
MRLLWALARELLMNLERMNMPRRKIAARTAKMVLEIAFWEPMWAQSSPRPALQTAAHCFWLVMA